MSIVDIQLEGHLTEPALAAAHAGALAQLPPEKNASRITYLCEQMTGYDMAARHEFVRWHRAHSSRIGAVAIVTDRALWHMVVSAMALASGQTMRAFHTVDQAHEWLEEV